MRFWRRRPAPKVKSFDEAAERELIQRLDDLKRRWIADEVSAEMARMESDQIARERCRVRGY